MSSVVPPVRAPAHSVGETLRPLTLAIFSGVAAGIHASVVSEHLEEYWLYGAFFVAVAAFQGVWALAIVQCPTARVAMVGIVASVGVLLLWALSRTAGLPIGPEPWTAEAVGSLDVVSGLAEVAIVALALKITNPEPKGRHHG